jgi:hypothetical protein
MPLVSLERSNVAKATAVGVLSGLGLSSLILRDVAIHSKSVLVNFYTNGTMDFSVDITYLARSALVLTFSVFVVGLILGVVMVKARMKTDRPVIASDEPVVVGVLDAVSNSADPHATWSNIAGNAQLEKHAQVLLKSGLLRGVVTEGRMSYELTDAGLRFLKEYKRIAHDLEQKVAASQQYR